MMLRAHKYIVGNASLLAADSSYEKDASLPVWDSPLSMDEAMLYSMLFISIKIIQGTGVQCYKRSIQR